MVHLYKKLYSIILYFVFTTTLSAQAVIEYPIEVFLYKDDSHNLSDEMTINVNAGATHMYLQVNNLNAAIEMSYRVDGGNWQDCAPDYTGYEKDEAYGGLGGGFGTVRFITPIDGLSGAGSHTLQFRYNYQPASETLGYRILAMEFRGGVSGEDLLTDTEIIQEDPSGWVGPFGAGASAEAAEGKTLWEQESILKDPSGVDITASCADCHASSGYDLKYFNYSNKSIEARSVFHALSREEGQKIAQYIRDLNADWQSENGRPWQPPFQPGPDADNDPDEWAAGQGLENVLDSDADMITELFGSSNPSEEQIRTAINDFGENTNIRTQRVSVQFPDWNEWLPRVHPKDLRANGGPYAGNVNGVIANDEWNSIDAAYHTARADAANGVALAQQSDNCRCHNNNALFAAVNKLVEAPSKVIWNSEFPSNSYAQGSASKNVSFEEKKRHLGAYVGVKTFELVHLNGLHKITNYENIDAADIEALQWPTKHWVVFQNAAHVSSSDRGRSYWWADDDGNDNHLSVAELKGIYLSSVWYQVQLTITPGHRLGNSVEPNDNAYNLMHVNKMSYASGIMEPARFLQNYLKAAEQRTNDFNVSGSNTGGYAGWNMRELSPWRLYGSNEFPNGEETMLFDRLDDYHDGLTRKARNVFISEVTERLQYLTDNDKWGPRITLQESMTRGSNGSERYMKLEERSAVPVSALNEDNSFGDSFFYNRRWFTDYGNNHGRFISGDKDAVEVDAAFSLLDIAKDGDVIDESVFNSFRAWANATWDFSAWPTFGNVPIEYILTVNNGTGSGAYIAGTSVEIAATVPSGYEFVQWDGDFGDLDCRTCENATVTIPNDNVEVTATFQLIEYSLTVNDGTGGGTYPEGTMVPISAMVSEREVFVQWNGDVDFVACITCKNTTVTMPNRAVTLTAEVSILPLSNVEVIKSVVYPNPFSSYVSIKGIKLSENVTVYDFAGSLVFSGQGTATIDLSNHENGLYVIKVGEDIHRVMKRD